jgi:hypothetical protein
MLSYEKSRSLTLQHRPLPSLPSTYRYPNSQHVTSKSDTRQYQTAKGQSSCRLRKFRPEWLYGGVLPISWRTGWFSGLSRMRSSVKLASPMSCDKCTNRRTGRPWLCRERVIEVAYSLGFLLEISRWIHFTRTPVRSKIAITKAAIHLTIIFTLYFTCIYAVIDFLDNQVQVLAAHNNMSVFP